MPNLAGKTELTDVLSKLQFILPSIFKCARWSIRNGDIQALREIAYAKCIMVLRWHAL